MSAPFLSLLRMKREAVLSYGGSLFSSFPFLDLMKTTSKKSQALYKQTFSLSCVYCCRMSLYQIMAASAVLGFTALNMQKDDNTE